MINLLRAALLILGTALVSFEVLLNRRRKKPLRLSQWVLGIGAGISICYLVFLWGNHLNFPLNLDLMEGTVLQHFQRAVNSEPVYPEPTPAYVPLAYNVLFYLFSVPFAWILGVGLPTLRFVSILGTLISGSILFLVVREKTSSLWWGLMAAGLFAGAYRVMDAYLDTAHSDSWLLGTAMLGSYLIDRQRSRKWNLVGVVVLVSSFWFKQHGAWFAIGGVLFLTWSEGVRRSIPYWITAFLLGPALYIGAGPVLFGSHYHYFTWEVPRRWSQLDIGTFRRFIAFTVKSYPVLALISALTVVWTVFKDHKSLNIWHFQFFFAVLTGFMGTLDAGSSNNVYIPMGMWLILLGTLGLHQVWTSVDAVCRYRLHFVAFLASFAVLLHNPVEVISSSRAEQNYAELVDMLSQLKGTVYAPSLGQLPTGYELYPAAHWVALEDMIRGPGVDTRNHPKTRQMLEPCIHPDGPAFILANYPLEVYPWIAFLNDYYVLESDFGDRFKPLRVLPARWDHGWPRYLYRYEPKKHQKESAEQ